VWWLICGPAACDAVLHSHGGEACFLLTARSVGRDIDEIKLRGPAGALLPAAFAATERGVGLGPAWYRARRAPTVRAPGLDHGAGGMGATGHRDGRSLALHYRLPLVADNLRGVEATLITTWRVGLDISRRRAGVASQTCARWPLPRCWAAFSRFGGCWRVGLANGLRWDLTGFLPARSR